MIPYQAIDINFNGAPEQCFVVEVIGTIQYVIPKKYIDMDPTLSADVDAFNTASGPFPKLGGLASTETFKLSNGATFSGKYHGMIAHVSNVVVSTGTVASTVAIGSALPAGSNTIGNVNLTSALQAGTNVIGKVTIDQTSPGTTDSVTIKALPTGSNTIGNVNIASAIPTGSNVIGKVTIDQTAPGTTDGVTIKATGVYAPVSPTNISSTITTGGTAQQLAAANAVRRGWWVRNNSSTDSLWVSDMTTAVQSQPSLEIKAGELYESAIHGCSALALSIIGPTTGQSYTGREW